MGGAIVGGIGGFVAGVVLWQLLFGPSGHFEAPNWWVTDSDGRPILGFIVLVICVVAGAVLGGGVG